MKELWNNKRLRYICLAIFVVAATATAILLINNNGKTISDGSNNEGKINVEESTSLYSQITEVNCDNTLVFDFGEKEEILTKDFTNEQKLNLIFRNLELSNKLDKASKSDFEDAVKKVFGPSFNQEFNISNFKYKDKIYSTSGNDLESIESTKCETNIVTKNFSFSPSEIGIELGIKKEGKLYTIDNKLVGEFSDEAKMYELLDSSTAYNYKYEFEGSNPYLIKVTPLIKIRGLE